MLATPIAPAIGALNAGAASSYFLPIGITT